MQWSAYTHRLRRTCTSAAGRRQPRSAIIRVNPWRSMLVGNCCPPYAICPIRRWSSSRTLMLRSSAAFASEMMASETARKHMRSMRWGTSGARGRVPMILNGSIRGCSSAPKACCRWLLPGHPVASSARPASCPRTRRGKATSTAWLPGWPWPGWPGDSERCWNQPLAITAARPAPPSSSATSQLGTGELPRHCLGDSHGQLVSPPLDARMGTIEGTATPELSYQ